MTTNHSYDEDDLDNLGINESFEDSNAERADHEQQNIADLDEDTSPDLHQSERDNLDYEFYSQPTVRLSPPLPPGLPSPPDGWYYWGESCLDHVSKEPSYDIIAGDAHFGWYVTEHTYGYYGACAGPWALRINSPIYILNVLTDHRP